MQKLYKVRCSDEELLRIYYSARFNFINKREIKSIFGGSYRLTREIYDSILIEASQNGIEYPSGYVPINKVFEKIGIEISIIERNYQKQKKLGLHKSEAQS